MISRLVLIIVGVFVLFTILYAVVGKLLPMLGRISGIFYIVFEWGSWFARKSFSMVRDFIENTIKTYLGLMWLSFGIWAALKIAKIIAEATGKAGLVGSAIGAAISATIVVTVFVALLGFHSMIMDVNREITRYMASAERAIEEMLNPYAYWGYSVITVKTNKSFENILEGIFTGYFLAKEKTPSGKISEIIYVGNITCQEISSIIKEVFSRTIYKGGFILIENCFTNDVGNYSISIFGRYTPITKSFSSTDLGKTTCYCTTQFFFTTKTEPCSCDKAIRKILSEEIGDKVSIEDYVCSFDIGIRNFIFDSENIQIEINYMYCDVKVKVDDVEMSYSLFFDDAKTYTNILYPISKNLTFLGARYSDIDSTGYSVIEGIGKYSITYPKLYIDLSKLSSGQEDVKAIILSRMISEDMRTLAIKIRKVE